MNLEYFYALRSIDKSESFTFGDTEIENASLQSATNSRPLPLFTLVFKNSKDAISFLRSKRFRHPREIGRFDKCNRALSTYAPQPPTTNYP